MVVQSGGASLPEWIPPLLGALLGGLLSLAGGVVAQDRRADIEEKKRRQALRTRLRYMLEITQVVGSSLRETNPRYGVAVEAMQQLLDLWAPFDEMAPDLHLIGGINLQRDIYALCAQVRVVANGLIASEVRFGEIDREVDNGNPRTIRRWCGRTRSVVSHRRGLHEKGPSLASQAAAILPRL